MRLFRFLVIFLVFSFVFAACSSKDEEFELDGSEENQNDNGNGDGENVNGDQNQQNLNCGNGITDDGEVCDGSTRECSAVDSSYASGTATCKADCSGWDTSTCQTKSNEGGEGGEGNNNQNVGFDKNSNGIWVDPSTYLIWENPMGNKGVGGTGVGQAKAVEYCENLVLAGADDWRLPTIDELRTLVRGVSTTMTGGKCPTSEFCTDQDSCNKDKDDKNGFGNSCLGCNALGDTYDPTISYLSENDCQLSDRQIENGEIYIVPIMFGDPGRVWSNTPNTGLVGSFANAYWFLNYNAGYIGNGIASSDSHWVRCVRNGTANDIPEQEAKPELDPSLECIIDTDCPEGKWCERNKCVIKPEETYIASNGLEWQAGRVEKAASWEAAKTYCDSLELAGKSDWRLPNIDELKSLSTCDKTAACGITNDCLSFTSCGGQQCKNNTCASGNYIPAEVGQQTDSCWTISEESVATSNAWLVSFSNGSVFYQAKTSSSFYARCVRGTIN